MSGWLLAVIVFGASFLSVVSALFINNRMNPQAVAPPRMSELPSDIEDVSFDVDPAPYDFRLASRKVVPSVVRIDTQIVQFGFTGEQSSAMGSGSGAVISEDGYIVTNAHVVSQETGRAADRVSVTFHNGKSLDAEVIGLDVRSDLALLKVDATNLVPVEFADSDKVIVGEWALACGNPLGYDYTVSVGVVSSTGRTLQDPSAATLLDLIQTDAAINQGNSGGPLCNSQGQVIGINTAIASVQGTRGSIGIGFAIPSNTVQRIVEELRETGRVAYAGLGVVFHPIPNILTIDEARGELKRYLDIEEDPPRRGALIQRVMSEQARIAGLRPFDIILGADGEEIDITADFQRIARDKRPGDTIELEIWSQGEEKTVTVTMVDVNL